MYASLKDAGLHVRCNHMLLMQQLLLLHPDVHSSASMHQVLSLRFDFTSFGDFILLNSRSVYLAGVSQSATARLAGCSTSGPWPSVETGSCADPMPMQDQLHALASVRGLLVIAKMHAHQGKVSLHHVRRVKLHRTH